MLSGSLFSNNNKVPINHLHSPWPHGELSEERPTFIVQTKISIAPSATSQNRILMEVLMKQPLPAQVAHPRM